jgi:predicted dehydrogenase
MCLTVEDCDKVVEAARKSDRIVQIGFQRRADPRFIEAMKLVHAGELGKLVEGRIQWSNAWGPLYGWFGQQKRSGDWMVEQAVHNWDVMNWAIGSAESNALPVRAMGMGNNELFREKQPDRDVHDYYSAVVEYPNGCIVNIVHSWTAPSAFDGEYTRLIGTKGGIDFNSGWISYRRDLKQPNRKGFKDDGTLIDNTTRALEAFVTSVRTRKPPVAGVEIGRGAVLACLLVRAAVHGRKAVTMDEMLKKA